MDIEQLPPNQPNFLLIVVLFVVALMVILVGAYFFLHREGSHLFPPAQHKIPGVASINSPAFPPAAAPAPSA